MVLFSGDAFNPSLLSTITKVSSTKSETATEFCFGAFEDDPSYAFEHVCNSVQGKQMIPVLNAAGIAAACVGNHDLDFGVAQLGAHAEACNFPWLMANILDRKTGPPWGSISNIRGFIIDGAVGLQFDGGNYYLLGLVRV